MQPVLSPLLHCAASSLSSSDYAASSLSCTDYAASSLSSTYCAVSSLSSTSLCSQFSLLDFTVQPVLSSTHYAPVLSPLLTMQPVFSPLLAAASSLSSTDYPASSLYLCTMQPVLRHAATVVLSPVLPIQLILSPFSLCN